MICFGMVNSTDAAARCRRPEPALRIDEQIEDPTFRQTRGCVEAGELPIAITDQSPAYTEADPNCSRPVLGKGDWINFFQRRQSIRFRVMVKCLGRSLPTRKPVAVNTADFANPDIAARVFEDA